MNSKEFFKVTSLGEVLERTRAFPRVDDEVLPLERCADRILSRDVVSQIDLPQFNRATMDGYAVRARSTFGASEGQPALLTVAGSVEMGEVPTVPVGPGEAVRIATGGMLPEGADCVVMVEHVQTLDETTLELYKSGAPLQHVMEIGEDFRQGEKILARGSRIRPQEMGVLAALGETSVSVYREPVVAIISSGDEIVPVEETPRLSQLRDVNAHTLCGLVKASGAVPLYLGIARDRFDELDALSRKALAEADLVLISGGSSVGSRDFTLDVVRGLSDSEILVHGVSISPGKPTILARCGHKAIWGLPGQVTSAMIVFHIMIRPMVERIGGLSENRRDSKNAVRAELSRNVSSVQGREDYVRVRVVSRHDRLSAEPILGKSGLISTMVKADGLIRIDMNSEGLDKGTVVDVIPF